MPSSINHCKINLVMTKAPLSHMFQANLYFWKMITCYFIKKQFHSHFFKPSCFVYCFLLVVKNKQTWLSTTLKMRLLLSDNLTPKQQSIFTSLVPAPSNT